MQYFTKTLFESILISHCFTPKSKKVLSCMCHLQPKRRKCFASFFFLPPFLLPLSCFIILYSISLSFFLFGCKTKQGKQGNILGYSQSEELSDSIVGFGNKNNTSIRLSLQSLQQDLREVCSGKEFDPTSLNTRCRLVIMQWVFLFVFW